MKHSIAVLVPSYDGKLMTGTVTSLFQLQAGLNQGGHAMSVLFQNGIAIVEEARNLLLASFLQHDFTAALCLDADIEFGNTDFAWLLKGAEIYDVVCGMYRAKTDEPTFFMTPVEGADKAQDFIRCTRAPAGFMYVPRRVFQQVWDNQDNEYDHATGKVRPVFECGMRNGQFVGEDYSFCDKAIEAGFTIAAATRVNLKHYGVKAYEGAFVS